MGVLNATPDSFSDAREHRTLDDRLRQAEALLAAGADLLDIGGESNVTNRPAVSVEEELERVVALIERVTGELGATVSVDTYKPAVAEAAVAAGATIVNDISGLADPALAEVCARHGRGAGGHAHARRAQAAVARRRRARWTSSAGCATAAAYAQSLGVRERHPRPGAGLRQDARADRRRPARPAGARRARPPRPAGRVAQGLRRRDRRAPAARAARRDAGRDRPRRRRRGDLPARPRRRRGARLPRRARGPARASASCRRTRASRSTCAANRSADRPPR